MAKSLPQDQQVAVVDHPLMSGKFKYFTLGYPEHPALPVYAIYQPTLNRFINIVASIDIAQQLRRVLSSRYQCYIVCLNTADNYQPNLIDNDVCEHWTLPDPIKLIHFDQMDASTTYFADNLVPATDTPNWDIEKEKAWCLMCQYWLIFLQRFKRQLDTADLVLRAVPHIKPDKSEYHQQITTQISDILYTTRDIDLADQKIRDLLAQDDTPSSYNVNVILERGVEQF